MILVTGGAGYLGTHTCVELSKAGFELLVLDNFSNSTRSNLTGVEQITQKKLHVIQGDIRDEDLLHNLFRCYPISAVIHFAGLKDLSESLLNPQAYYDVNLNGTITLCNQMAAAGCKNLVFSSSASIYAESPRSSINEKHKIDAVTPYSKTKLMAESLLKDLYTADKSWAISILRYFNPVGAHHSGLIGESPKNNPTNLMPVLTNVATGEAPFLKIFGNDYPTPDGTAIRDYIHVQDLASAHVTALKRQIREPSEIDTFNIGTGIGYSVLEMVNTFERVTGCSIPYRIVGHRSHDLGYSLADPSYARRNLGWKAAYNLEQMCLDSWRWALKTQNMSVS